MTCISIASINDDNDDHHDNDKSAKSHYMLLIIVIGSCSLFLVIVCMVIYFIKLRKNYKNIESFLIEDDILVSDTSIAKNM